MYSTPGAGGVLQTQLCPAGLVHVIAGGSAGKHASDRTTHVAARRVKERKEGREKERKEVVIVLEHQKRRRGRGEGEASTPTPPAVVRIGDFQTGPEDVQALAHLCPTERKEGRS